MKEIKVSIRPTDVKSVSFDNTFKMSNGVQTKMTVNANVAVKLNPQQPTTAVVICKFEAADEAEAMKFSLETITGVSVDTFVDNLDDFIKKNYISVIMLSINEKIRSVAGALGLNIQVPPVALVYGASENGISATGECNVVDFKPGKK